MSFPTLRFDLSQRAEQRFLLQPRLLQAVEVLQLGALDLCQYLADKALSNEALELESTVQPLAGYESERFEFRSARSQAEAGLAHQRLLEGQPERGAGLQGWIEDQLLVMDLRAGELAWVRYLVSCLDESGYLAPDDDRLLRGAQALGLQGGHSALGRAIAQLQSLEPRGLGGRNAEEALLLQLDPNDPDYPLLCALIENCLLDVARNKLPKVARKLGLEARELTRLVSRLAELDPRPAARWSGEAAPVVHPDLVLRSQPDGSYVLRLDRGLWPDVRIDPGVQALAQDEGQPKDVRQHLRRKLEEARWLVDALAQRQTTLLRVANAIFQAQAPFLREGPAKLMPLSMQTVAEELGLAVSTISRAVAGKYVETPFGLRPLREFFQSKAGGTSREGLRGRVEALVAGEDPLAPLSDEDLVAKLQREGHAVARRTVAKYRRELGIKSSYQRVVHALPATQPTAA